MEHKPGDVANGHVLGEDLVWRPLESALQSAAPTSPAPAPVHVWVLAGLSGFLYLLFAIVYAPYPDGATSYRAGYFSAPTAAAVVAAVLIAKRLENPWRVVLAVALPPLAAGILWVVMNASNLASDADERRDLGTSVKSTISLPPTINGWEKFDTPQVREARRQMKEQAPVVVGDEVTPKIEFYQKGSDTLVITAFNTIDGSDAQRELARSPVHAVRDSIAGAQAATHRNATPPRTFESGIKGVAMQCSALEQQSAVVCAWADSGSLGVAMLTGKSVDESAVVTRGLLGLVRQTIP